MRKINLVILLSLVLAGCGGGSAKEMLGMNTDAPDEFAVERKPKLDVPPSFKLRPPSTAAEKQENAADTRNEVKEKILGVPSVPIQTGDSTQDSFLKKMNANNANPDIRDVLTKEYPKTDDKDMLDKIRSLSNDNNEKTLVDAKKEKERIDNNKKDNKPLDQGETPTKSENDGKSIIDKIFD